MRTERPHNITYLKLAGDAFRVERVEDGWGGGGGWWGNQIVLMQKFLLGSPALSKSFSSSAPDCDGPQGPSTAGPESVNVSRHLSFLSGSRSLVWLLTAHCVITVTDY